MAMRFALRLSAATIFLLLILSAKPANAAGCENIYDCGYRESCKSGVCVFDGLSCKYDSECDAFEFCNTGAYQCQIAQGRCHTSSDCLGGKVCDANNYCSTLAGEGGIGASNRSDTGGFPELLNSTMNLTPNSTPAIKDFRSADPKINKTIQKMKKSVNASIASTEKQSQKSVGGFFSFFFDFLRRLFGG